MPCDTLAIHVKDVVGHRLDFALQDRQAVLLEHRGRDQVRKIAARDVHATKRGNAHPAHRKLPVSLQEGIEVVVNRLEVGDGSLGQARHLLRVVDHVDAELLRVAPGRRAVQARVQIGVADHEPALATLQRMSSHLIQPIEVLVGWVKYKPIQVVPLTHDGR